MEGQELEEFVEAFNTKYRVTFDWVFDYQYPGYFSYFKGPWTVFFTPEHSDKGMVDIQINFEDDPIDDLGDAVPLVPRTPERLFEIASHYLTKIDTAPSVLDWKPKT